MADFINTIDALGDDAVVDGIIKRTITEFKDDRITAVGKSAFKKCANLVTVDIPSAVTITYDSFNGCAALANLNIPAVTRIEPYNAFSGCKALPKVVLPACSYIGQGAFSFCFALEVVDCAVTDSLYIGNSAFGSDPLKALILRSNSVATLANTNALLGTEIYYGTGYIYVPSALIDSYKAAANWSDFADQFRNLEEWTVDGTVTGELDLVNRHMVRFYNSDGTLLGYQIVATGSNATYNGTPVYPEDSSWKFTGFLPSPTNVTEDMDCYAQYGEPISLATASWAQISEISAEGTGANYFSVGDTKPISLKGTMGTLTLDTTLHVFVLGINHNSAVEGTGIQFGGFKSEAGADGKNICLVDDAYNTYKTNGTKIFNMNHWGNSNNGGWAACDMRYDILGSTDVAPSGYGSSKTSSSVGYDATATCATNPVANTLMSCLPADLRAVMKPITKYTDNVGGGSGHVEANVTASVDYLPLLGEMELFGTGGSDNNEFENTKQVQYEYFASGNSKRVKYRHSDTASTAIWWERSPHKSNNTRFCCVGTGGYADSDTARDSNGVAPAFMV